MVYFDIDINFETTFSLFIYEELVMKRQLSNSKKTTAGTRDESGVDGEKSKKDSKRKLTSATQQPKDERPVLRIKRHAVRKIAISFGVFSIIYIYSYFFPAASVFDVLGAANRIYDGSPIGQTMKCSSDYEKERKESSYVTCLPKECGRFVSDAIVSHQEALELRMLAELVFNMASPSGGVAVFDLSSGALSNGTQFVNLYKLLGNDERTKVLRSKSLDIFQRVKNKILSALAMSFRVPAESLYLTSPVFFSRMTTKPAKTMNDEYWNVHVDMKTYGKFHYTTLLYLSTFGDEFYGGRFIFLDPIRNVTVEPRFGRVSVFTSGSENPHMVEKLTQGVRYAMTIPFTCDARHKAIIRW